MKTITFKIFIAIISLGIILFTRLIWAGDSLNNEKMNDWKILIKSDIDKDKSLAKKMVLDSRKDTIKNLLAILNSPLREKEEFYNAGTPRNIAIFLLGRYRAKESVIDLTKWLVPKPGQSVVVDEESFFTPAGSALVEIGLPSVQPLIELLNTEENSSVFQLYVKMLVSIKGLPETELLFQSLISEEKDETKSKNLKRAFDFMKNPIFRKSLETINETRPFKAD